MFRFNNVKAVFFVKDFSGQTSHVDLLFHDRLPPMECLWIRIRFDDGETVEGIIHNALDYIVGPGFFMAPADPIGNNWLIYVSKSKLTGFEILGLRPQGEELASLQKCLASTSPPSELYNLKVNKRSHFDERSRCFC